MSYDCGKRIRRIKWGLIDQNGHLDVQRKQFDFQALKDAGMEIPMEYEGTC